MDFISAQQVADKWGISKRRVQVLCAEKRIPNSVRIGNMWVIPENAQKPTDARVKIAHSPKLNNPIKKARKALRTISSEAYMAIQKDVVSPSEAKRCILSLFTLELIELIIEKPSDDLAEQIYTFFELNTHMSLEVSDKVRELFRDFLVENPFCFDDALSWAYQYVNKLCKDTGLENTQFFTEKYMITTLVDNCNIESGYGKILDPACGGGNFLLYALDYLCENSRLPSENDLPQFINSNMMRLYGYELDPTSAIIASVNLRIKAMQIMKEHGYSVADSEFFSFSPNIYHSTESNIEGALDIASDNHTVKKVGTPQISSLASIFSSTEFLFTNPPFQTVKGMGGNLKEFLKTNYPNSKCDMCNAFIEFALNLLADNGICAMVTQNSWLYLNSFELLRRSLIKQYTIKSIIELGSNAFYDLSGEKANVALLIAQKNQPDYKTSFPAYSFKNLAQNETERLLSSWHGLGRYMTSINQLDVLKQPSARFRISCTSQMQHLQINGSVYGNYAVPMQGTSTGDSKTLVSYFWEHIGDEVWCPVSKGGGYSRWLGLNCYAVKWGKNGEFIKATNGSAIRNAKYFNETQLVFSDTGTAGLNVRLLINGQIFIASGPGIRVTQGNYLAHLAFLNSRFASYFIRLLSPKLTIAAGYIAKIPVLNELLSSKALSELANLCIELKKDRLSRRPTNLEYDPLSDIGKATTLNEQAQRWFLKDIEDEWRQLCAEKEIDEFILDSFSLTDAERADISSQVGCHALDIKSKHSLTVIELDEFISGLLSVNCSLNRTRSDKKYLGCDGVIEYLAHKYAVSPSMIYQAASGSTLRFHKTLSKYKDAYIHSLVLSVLGYSTRTLPKELRLSELIEEINLSFPSLGSNLEEISDWIQNSLTEFHAAAFLGKPLIYYSAKNNAIENY